MRLFLFLSMVFVGLCSCNNDLTTIGQDLINNSNNINQKDIRLDRTGTIKLDSFVTSSGEGGYAISEMYMGRYEDVYSGITEAYPCFQIAPQTQPSINKQYDLDSVTFHFTYANRIWGDTVTAKPQTFELWQLSNLPDLPVDANNRSSYFYNTSSIPWGKQLAEVTFLPRKKNIENTYFKMPLTDPYWKEMFEMMKYKDDIFTPNPNHNITYYKFLQYFKGLAIKAKETNDCLLAIKASPDSLYMRFHYHQAENNYYVDLKLLSQTTAYQYNAIYTTPPEYFTALKKQEDEVLFSQNDVAVVQGLSGYMVKMVLPAPDVLPAYSTVIKAQIEIKPRIWNYPNIPMPTTIAVYKTNDLNEVLDQAYNTTTNPITGKFVSDPENKENSRYIFDITDYYLQLQNSPPVIGAESQLLLTIPNLSSSYNRMVLEELPILRLYFANYRD